MKKILIIEDETPVRENLVELLSAEGYSPVQARDGEEGVRLAWETLPDLILCDINMPRMDGFGVLSRISRDPLTATIPFIFLTARTEREDLRRGMSLGADDYIMKPFSLDDVLEAIQTRLEKRALIEKQAEKKLAELNKNIRLAMPGQMLAPLSVILSFSELLSNRQETSQLETSQLCAMGHEIHRAAGTLLRSIQNFILFSELELIQTDPVRLKALRDGRVFSAYTAITDMALLKARQDNREDDLRLRVQEATLSLSEVYLQKIIEELLDNAFKFSPLGSLVEVVGEVQPGQSDYLLRVSDQGRGMPPEQVAALASRGHPTGRGMDRQGQGIGLVIVRRLVELHQGAFTLQSESGQWTVVEVRLPIPKDTAHV